MKIEHVALWTRDLERSRAFYVTYFDGMANAKYTNPRTGFASYFVRFDDGARLELMQMPGIVEGANTPEQQALGWVHIAFKVGGRDVVDALTDRLRADGYPIAGEPRVTGDGYYESVVLDPDGNRVELVA
ncbi:MAG: VOC family protein [Anaerolineae bacterium]|nr:VOC family protein [Anaerolineae bacterium]